MMTLPIFQVDAFTENIFGGNPAAVCPLKNWLPDEVLQQIAAENNLSETAFYVQENEQVFSLRWFTPTSEVDLCGHATLAVAHVLFAHYNYAFDTITFNAKIGTLSVAKKRDLLVMDFPAQAISPATEQANLLIEKAIGSKPVASYKSLYHLAVLPDEAAVLQVTPDLAAIQKLDTAALVITAKGEKVDFVSRCFAPKVGIPEDPVTGSAHCVLTPYWAKVLGKNDLQAQQVSKRKGDVQCMLQGDRVVLAGKAVTYLKGEITI